MEDNIDVVDVLYSENSKLKNELLDLKNAKALNESKISKLTAEKNSLLKENGNLRSQLEIANDTIKTLKVTFSDKAKDFSENEDKVDELKSLVDTLENKNADLKKNLQKRDDEISNLNLDLQMLKSEKEYLEKSLVTASSEIECLRKNGNPEVVFVDDEEENEEKEKLNIEQTSNVDLSSIANIVELIKKQSEIEIANFSKILVDEEKKSLQAKHDEDLLKIGKLESEKSQLEKSVNDLSSSLTNAETRINELLKELEDKKVQNTKFYTDNKALYNTQHNLEREIIDKKDTIKKLEIEINRLEIENKKYLSELTDQKIKNIHFENSNREFKSKISGNNIVAKKKTFKK